jgi:hypothetical protein
MSFRGTTNYGKKFLQNYRKQTKVVIPGNPGEGRGNPESRIFREFWIPAFAGMTELATPAKTSRKTFRSRGRCYLALTNWTS